jgi:hypothetical protein
LSEADTPQQSESAAQTTDRLIPKLGEGVLLAVASASAYLFAFNFEQGFASAFNIPNVFINVALTSILIMAAKFITVVLLFQPYVNMAILALNSLSPSRRMIVGPFAAVGTLIFLFIYLMGWENWKYWLIIPVAIVIFIGLIFALAFQHGDGSYSEKLVRQLEAEADRIDTWALVRQRFGANVTIIIITLVMVYLLSFFAGWGEGLKQEEFLVTNTSPEMVVLRIYGENIICAPFDRSTKEIEGKFVVLKLAEAPGLVFSLEKIGPLRRAELATSTLAPTVIAPTVVSPIMVSPTGTHVLTSTNTLSP